MLEILLVTLLPLCVVVMDCRILVQKTVDRSYHALRSGGSTGKTYNICKTHNR